MKKILIITFLLMSVEAMPQAAGYKLYGIRQSNAGVLDSIDRKEFTDSLFQRGSLIFVGFTLEYYSQFYNPILPAGFSNFIKGADGVYRNFNMIVSNAVMPPATMTNMIGFTPAQSVHTHAQSEITNLVNDMAGKASLVSPAFTTPNIGAASASSVTATGDIVSSSGGIGYVTGNGGTVTQSGNKGTAVTLNKRTGQITTTNAALAAGAEVSFNLNNSTIAANDIVLVSILGGGTVGSYMAGVTAIGAGLATITITNLSTGSLSQALVINFIVLKGSVN